MALKVFNKIEDFACLLLTNSFEAVDYAVSNAIIVPETFAKGFKNSLILLQKKIYPSIGELLNPIEYGLVLYAETIRQIRNKLLDSNDGDSKWCEVLFNCRAFIEMFLDEDMRGKLSGMIPFLTDSQREAITKDYGLFVNYICKFSFSDILKEFINNKLSEFFGKLEVILNKIQSIQTVNALLDGYDAILEAGYIYDILNEYDKFYRCALSLCDLEKKSFEAKDTILKKLYLRPGGFRGYEIDADASYSEESKFIAEAKKVENEINSRINNIKNALELSFTDFYLASDFINSTISPVVYKRMSGTSPISMF